MVIRQYVTHIKNHTREELVAGNKPYYECRTRQLSRKSLMPIVQIIQEKQSPPDTAISN